MKRLKLTPKQIADYIPESLDEIAGNYELIEYFRSRMSCPPEEDPSLMIVGDPGTGKTSSALAYLRLRLKDSQSGYADSSGHFATLAGKQYGYVRINGTVVNRKRAQDLVGDATESSAIHTFVLLDEAGELFFQGVEDVLRAMLEHPNVTSYATAQDFHTKKRPTDTDKQHDNRLASFLRRFHNNIVSTEKPTEEEVAAQLHKRCDAWSIERESGAVEMLARKAKGIFSYAQGGLVRAAVRGRKLTIQLVMEYNPDPLTM